MKTMTQSKNSTLNNIIKNGVVDNLDLQKYLLATGLLQDSIQQSLDMIVTDGGFNDVAVRGEFDLKYPSIMKKPNPIDVVFKDKAKHDVQIPIIGSLVAQVQENKTNEKAILNQISGTPSTKDIELAERLAKLRGEEKAIIIMMIIIIIITIIITTEMIIITFLLFFCLLCLNHQPHHHHLLMVAMVKAMMMMMMMMMMTIEI